MDVFAIVFITSGDRFWRCQPQRTQRFALANPGTRVVKVNRLLLQLGSVAISQALCKKMRMPDTGHNNLLQHLCYFNYLRFSDYAVPAVVGISSKPSIERADTTRGFFHYRMVIVDFSRSGRASQWNTPKPSDRLRRTSIAFLGKALGSQQITKLDLLISCCFDCYHRLL